MVAAPNNVGSKNRMKERFLKTIDMHQSIIHKIVSFYVSDQEEKKDLFQEILLQLWRSFPSFEQRSSITTWMYRVALNTALLHQRKRFSAARTLEKYALEKGNKTDFQEKDRISSLYRAIDHLGPLDRAIALLYLEEKTYREIADILNLTSSNVGVRVSRIKQKLKTLMSDEKED